MQQELGSFDMLQKAVAQTATQSRAFHESGDIGHHQGLLIIKGHDAQIGDQRSEWVAAHLGTGLGEAGEKCRFPCVGQTHQTHICQEFQG